MSSINSVFFHLCILLSLSFNYASETQHKTKAATEKQHDLWCYRCDSMADGEKCLNLVGNDSSTHMKCSREQKKCQVHRISMSTSTEEVTGKPRLWLLHRNCSEICEPGCIQIGERTKLHSCITCCDEQNFCNAGSGADGRFFINRDSESVLLLLQSIVVLMKFVIK